MSKYAPLKYQQPSNNNTKYDMRNSLILPAARHLVFIINRLCFIVSTVSWGQTTSCCKPIFVQKTADLYSRFKMKGEIDSADDDVKVWTTLNALCAIAPGFNVNWKPSSESIGVNSLSTTHGCCSIKRALRPEYLASLSLWVNTYLTYSM